MITPIDNSALTLNGDPQRHTAQSFHKQILCKKCICADQNCPQQIFTHIDTSSTKVDAWSAERIFPSPPLYSFVTRIFKRLRKISKGSHLFNTILP